MKSMRTIFLIIFALLWALATAAQTDVTTTGGTAKTIPEFSGSTTIVDSPFTIDSNGGLLLGSFSSYVAGNNIALGGLVNLTQECCSIDATHAGYGSWLNYNGYFNGSDWIQPEGSLATYMYTTNWHAGGWAWYANAATGTNGDAFTPNQVASMDGSGDFSMNGRLTVGTGVANSGGGLKHMRFQGCFTSGSQGNASCVMTVSWPGTAFPDTNYTLSCMTFSEPGVVFMSTVKAAGSINASFFSATSGLAAGEVDCIAIHD
jgi:hypothetical protein